MATGVRSRYVDALGGTPSTLSAAALQEMFAPLAPMDVPLHAPPRDEGYSDDGYDALEGDFQKEAVNPDVRQGWLSWLFGWEQEVSLPDNLYKPVRTGSTLLVVWGQETVKSSGLIERITY